MNHNFSAVALARSLGSGIVDVKFTGLFSLYEYFVVVTVTFERAVYNITESDAVAEVCLIKNPETGGMITIDDIMTTPGTATGW